MPDDKHGKRAVNKVYQKSANTVQTNSSSTKPLAGTGSIKKETKTKPPQLARGN